VKKKKRTGRASPEAFQAHRSGQKILQSGLEEERAKRQRRCWEDVIWVGERGERQDCLGEEPGSKGVLKRSGRLLTRSKGGRCKTFHAGGAGDAVLGSTTLSVDQLIPGVHGKQHVYGVKTSANTIWRLLIRFIVDFEAKKWRGKARKRRTSGKKCIITRVGVHPTRRKEWCDV